MLHTKAIREEEVIRVLTLYGPSGHLGHVTIQFVKKSFSHRKESSSISPVVSEKKMTFGTYL